MFEAKVLFVSAEGSYRDVAEFLYKNFMEHMLEYFGDDSAWFVIDVKDVLEDAQSNVLLVLLKDRFGIDKEKLEDKDYLIIEAGG